MSAIVFGIPIKAQLTYGFLKDLVKAMVTSEQWKDIRRGLCDIRDNQPQDEWIERWVDYLYGIIGSETNSVDYGLGVNLWDVEETGQAVVGVLISHDWNAQDKQEVVQVPRLYGGDEITRFGMVNPKAVDFISPYVCGPIGYYKIPVHVCSDCQERLQKDA